MSQYIKGLNVGGEILNFSLNPESIGQTNTAYQSDVGYNGAAFNIGTNAAAIGGFYVFTYGNCMVTFPVYGVTSGTEYKVAAALVNSGGSYSVKVLTYKYVSSSGMLYIYQKENYIPTGYGSALFRIKLG